MSVLEALTKTKQRKPMKIEEVRGGANTWFAVRFILGHTAKKVCRDNLLRAHGKEEMCRAPFTMAHGKEEMCRVLRSPARHSVSRELF